MKGKVTIGGVYKLTEKPQYGSQIVEVESFDRRGRAYVSFGYLKGEKFVRKSYKGKDGQDVQRAYIPVELFAERLDLSKDKGEAMAEKTVPVDENGNEIPQSAEKKPKKTKLEIAQERLEAEKKREEEKAKKDEAKKKELATKRADKLKEAAKGVKGAKESEIASTASDGAVKTYMGLNLEQAKKANDAIKELKKAQDKAKKNAEKLVKAAQDAGLTEKQVAGDYSNNRTTKFVDLTDEEVEKALDALKEAAKKKKKDEALALKTNLNDEEKAELAKQEKTIEKFLPTFQTAAMQIGGAMTVINQKRLYRATHKTFEAYVAERFDISRPHAYSVMAAAQTFVALTEGEVVDSKSLPSITAAEAIHRGVKGLLKEGNFGDNPEIDQISRALARNTYQLAVQTAPQDKDGNPNITPAHLSSVFNTLNEVARTGVVEVDGKQVPVNLAASSFDEMITSQSAERVARLKANLQQRFEQATAQATAARQATANGAGAAINTTTGNGNVIPKGATPKLGTSCSIHGRVEVKDTTDDSITLGCDCEFIHTGEGFLFNKNPKYPEIQGAGN